MSVYRYDRIDGQLVEKNIAVEYRLWAAEFTHETGLELHISSGVRTKAVQQAGYEKYLKGLTHGVKWAKPSESSHCEAGPAGPRALDIRDSGEDAGVTVKGSRRWDIAVRTGKKRGFTWGGWGVPSNEGWHFENHVVRVGHYASTPKKPIVMQPHQRRTRAVVLRRRTPDTRSAALPGSLPPGTIGEFIGWTHGERVTGNDVWFRGISGNWFWSGGFAGGADTAGLNHLEKP